MPIKSLLQEAVNKLVAAEPGWKPATTPPAKGAKPGEKSVGRPATGTTSSAATLAESDYTLRQHWATVDVPSTDGLFVIQVEPIKSIALDGGGTFTFQEPV